MILIKNFYAFILYVSDSGLQCNKHNIVTDIECNVRIDRLPWVVVRTSGNDIALASGSGNIISFPLVRTTTLGQSVYPDIALHISNYYINIKFNLYDT